MLCLTLSLSADISTLKLPKMQFFCDVKTIKSLFIKGTAALESRLFCCRTRHDVKSWKVKRLLRWIKTVCLLDTLHELRSQEKNDGATSWTGCHLSKLGRAHRLLNSCREWVARDNWHPSAGRRAEQQQQQHEKLLWPNWIKSFANNRYLLNQLVHI